MTIVMKASVIIYDHKRDTTIWCINLTMRELSCDMFRIKATGASLRKKKVLWNWIQEVLFRRPENPVHFLKEYFVELKKNEPD